MKKNSGLGKFLAGAAVGAGLGILFAPKSPFPVHTATHKTQPRIF